MWRTLPRRITSGVQRLHGAQRVRGASEASGVIRASEVGLVKAIRASDRVYVWDTSYEPAAYRVHTVLELDRQPRRNESGETVRYLVKGPHAYWYVGYTSKARERWINDDLYVKLYPVDVPGLTPRQAVKQLWQPQEPTHDFITPLPLPVRWTFEVLTRCAGGIVLLVATPIMIWIIGATVYILGCIGGALLIMSYYCLDDIIEQVKRFLR